ncbi:hypothetical protein NITHO_1770005 [Nitrolancea hollandica Lb]|uniref:Uncharacterized protein n=1 Tax=Nitrolancea hollandica Lb TaxID=1129897 RepID=I4EEA7_9BACT|nr:hypothetical protein NITHO_1770005 [Nitrolancea hollandica Lb]
MNRQGNPGSNSGASPAEHKPSSGASAASCFGWKRDGTGWWVIAQIPGGLPDLAQPSTPGRALRLGRDLDGLSLAVQEQVVHR